MHLLRGLALLALLATLAACGAREPSLPRLGPDDAILAFGDSLTYGSGVGAEHSYPAQLARLTGRAVIQGGVPGETTAGGLERLPGALAAHQPRLVILCLGGNDFLRRQDESAIRSNLRAMLALLAQQRVAVLMVGVPRAMLSGEAASLYADLAGEFGVPLERKVLARVLANRSLKSDPIHPNESGYAEIAAAVAEALRRSGAI